MSIAEWVRQALNAARRREPVGDAGKKLDVVRAAARHDFPTADIDEMLTQMPVTEAMYLLDFSIAAQGALLEMIGRGALKILEISTRDLPPIRGLMEKYRDQPMDFADASLVHIANREGIPDIFTLDKRDFGVYRLNRGQPLNLLSA